MKAQTTTVINSLKSLARSIETLDPAKQAEQDLAADTIIGCFHIMDCSATTDIREWRARVPRHKALEKPSRAVATKLGRRAMGELIALTISELEASIRFRPDVEVGPLRVAPSRGPKRVTVDHLVAMREGRKKQVARQRDLIKFWGRNKSA